MGDAHETTYVVSSQFVSGARNPSSGASDSGSRGPGFEPHGRRVMSLSKALKAPQSTGTNPGSDGSVST